MKTELVVDIIILAPVLYGLVRGLFRGLVEELTSIVAIVVAIFCARAWAAPVAVWLRDLTTWDEKMLTIAAYLIVFLTVALALNVAARLLAKLLSAIHLGWINKLLGAVFGGLKWLLLVSVLLNGFDMLDEYFQFLKPEVKQQSLAYQPVKKVATIAWEEVQTTGIIPDKK